MGKPDDEEGAPRRPAALPGWRVIIPPERRPGLAGGEFSELPRGINDRRRHPSTPHEPDDTPDAA